MVIKIEKMDCLLAAAGRGAGGSRHKPHDKPRARKGGAAGSLDD